MEGWSAFAPDFVELDENRVYEEREDEFDIVYYVIIYANFKIEEISCPREMDEDDDLIIDITTRVHSIAEELPRLI